jgi:hypothetical protein
MDAATEVTVGTELTLTPDNEIDNELEMEEAPEALPVFEMLVEAPEESEGAPEALTDPEMEVEPETEMEVVIDNDGDNEGLVQYLKTLLLA